MKTANLLLIASIFVLVSCKNVNSDNATASNSTTSNKEYYQLKVYTFDSAEQEKVTDKYLKEAYLPGLKKEGINNIGVFKLRPNTDSIQKTYVLIPFKTMEQFLDLDDKLNNNMDYLAAADEYLNVSHDQPPFLVPTEYSDY